MHGLDDLMRSRRSVPLAQCDDIFLGGQPQINEVCAALLGNEVVHEAWADVLDSKPSNGSVDSSGIIDSHGDKLSAPALILHIRVRPPLAIFIMLDNADHLGDDLIRQSNGNNVSNVEVHLLKHGDVV